jgi:hypothetical protein
MGLRGMVDRLIGRTPHRRPPQPHPPLAAGQYVSYVQDRGDETWWSCHMTVLGQAEDGRWAVLALGREPAFDASVRLALDPSPVKGRQEVVPLGLGVVRGEPPTGGLGSMGHVAMAINLLTPARVPTACEALSATPVPVLYPCEIDEVFPLIDPWREAGYDKQHDLSPRVPITGLAGTTIVGTNNHIQVTSFGCGNPETPLPGYDDHIDFSHLTTPA